MGRPVIVDDGGSIRIKFYEAPDTNPGKKKARGKMDGLMDVDEYDPPADPKWKSEEPEVKGYSPGGSHKYTHARTAWVTVTGDADGTDLEAFDTIEIEVDGVGQKKIMLIRGNNGKLTVEVSSNVAEPIIESKSSERKRSYAVVNGGHITNVKRTLGDEMFSGMPSVSLEEIAYIGVIIV